MSKLPHLNMLVNWDVGHKFHPPSPTSTKTQHTLQTTGGSRGGQRGLAPLFFSEIFHYF